jgi:hypothetical protein
MSLILGGFSAATNLPKPHVAYSRQVYIVIHLPKACFAYSRWVYDTNNVAETYKLYVS